MTVNQQGEVRIERIEELPEGLTAFSGDMLDDRAFIISHSETGNHHVIDCDGVTLMERPLAPEFGEGMKILYAIVDAPTEMYINAERHHAPQPMEPGIYELTVSTEVDPFTKQARLVAD